MSDAMDLFEAMSTTRAVRRLRPDPVPDAVVERIVQAAVWGPTGANVQPWRVIVVRDVAKRRRLQELYIGPWNEYAKGHRAMLDSMPETARAKQRRMLAAADHLANHLHEAPAILVFCFNPQLMAITDTKLDRPSVVGGASVYPSVQNALLACRAQGLGCTLTTLLCLKETAFKELLGIPDDWGTCAYVPIGYPVGSGHGPLKRNPVDKMAFADAWGAPLRLRPTDA
jgi:nitroreductase